MASEATALGFLFGGLTRTTNTQYQKRKMDFCGQNRLFPEMDIFSKEANNQFQKIFIIIVIIIINIIIIVVVFVFVVIIIIIVLIQ